MKTLLVIAQEPALAAALGASLDAERYTIIPHAELWEAEEILAQGVVDACFLDAELTDVQPIRTIKQIRRLAPTCPVFIYSSVKQWEWEEDAYLLGVTHILAKPVRARLIQSLLDRLWQSQTPAAAEFLPPLTSREPTGAHEMERRPLSALQALRDLSGILTHSLRSESLLRQFLLLLRQILGVNRAAIFLRQPAASGALAPKPDDHSLRPACAIGLSPELLDHLVLSTERGIGRYLYRSGRILKNGSDEARGDLVAQKEFALLGAQVAIPILDRESLIGLAVFDGRLTGEFFANEELALIFHLLEGVGLAIKNSWLHDQLVAGHEMLTDILNQLGSGCVVVDRQLKVVHANPAARRLLLRSEKRLEFTDLPQEVGSKVFLALQSGAAEPPFKFTPAGNNQQIFEVRITPFNSRNSITANAVLLLVDDITQRERIHALEIEASGLRLTQAMSSQLAHAIGNSLVPIVTYQEFRDRKPEDRETIETLAHAAGEGIRRISRLSRQMRFLGDNSLGPLHPVLVSEIVADAVTQAQAAHSKPNAPQVVVSPTHPAAMALADREKMAHGLAEVILNALQSSPENLPVEIRWRIVTNSKGTAETVAIQVEDAGMGFTAEEAAKATEPFYSTRSTGLGIGLTAALRIVRLHSGTLQISTARGDSANTVTITLPLAPT